MPGLPIFKTKVMSYKNLKFELQNHATKIKSKIFIHEFNSIVNT
jgi:hypothetical protein